MSSFHERQKSLFNTLKDAEEQYSFSKSNKASDAQDYGTIDRQVYRRLKHEMRQFRGKESIYKRAEAKIQNCLRSRRLPDHLKNPQKYVYYSLSDVTPEQMSDSTNTSTALSFLRQLEEQNEIKVKTENDMDDGVFKKPTFNLSATVKKQDMKEQKVSFKSSKVIMPEYVVGVSQKKVKKDVKGERKSSDNSNSIKKVELKLEHLYTEDD